MPTEPGTDDEDKRPDDRWPDAVDMDTLEKLTNAYVSLLTAVASDP